MSLGQCEASEHYAEQLKDTIRCTLPKGRLAAFFAEPIQVNSASVCCIGCRIEQQLQGKSVEMYILSQMSLLGDCA